MLASGVQPDDYTEADVSRGTSPDGQRFVFVRDVGAAKDASAGETELWLVDNATGEQHKLLVESASDSEQNNLTGFSNAQFSPDGKFVYFETEAWPNSNAIHRIELTTFKEHFVTRGNCLLVIPRGRYRGKLLLGAHLYRRISKSPGLASYEWWGVIDERGRELASFPEGLQECACCYYSSAEVRNKIDKLLGIRQAGAPTM